MDNKIHIDPKHARMMNVINDIDENGTIPLVTEKLEHIRVIG